MNLQHQIMDYRVEIANKYLAGKGVEFGALHNPLKVNQEQAQIFYADKYTKFDLLHNFPELNQHQESVVATDIFIDLDTDDLQALLAYDFDFFIANHVIEHLVNPLRFLQNLSTVMKSGSYLYLALPDKEYTFDRNRELTTWNHLYQEYLQNTTKLSRAHLQDFIINITKDHLKILREKRRCTMIISIGLNASASVKCTVNVAFMSMFGTKKLLLNFLPERSPS